MEPKQETTQRLYDENICLSFGEARRIQHQMPDEETLEKFIEKKKRKNL